jgi:hypothetical protein
MSRLATARLGSALILSAGDRILRSRPLTLVQQSDFAVKWEKSSLPQEASTSTLEACTPQI